MGDQPSNRKEFVARMGTFFVMVGIGMMVFFILSEAAKTPMLSYFCWGTTLLTIGFVMRAQFKKPSGPPSNRFSVFQKLKRKPKEAKKEEKKK